MALVVDNSPLSPTCNSYVSLSEMLEYVSTRVPDPAVAIAWNTLTEDKQSMYLVNATRTLDGLGEWIGEKYWRDQRLDWPRVNAYVEDWMLEVTTFPVKIKEATCEMTIWAMQNAGLVSVQQNAAFNAIKVGPISIDFNEAVGGTSEKYFPDIVALILSDLGTMVNPSLPSSNKIKLIRLIRS